MKIRELLTNQSKWTKGAFAKTATGHPTDYDSNDAAKFCLVGAARKCYGRGEEGNAVLRTLIYEIDGRRPFRDAKNVASWNDALGRTFADVKALVERLDI